MVCDCDSSSVEEREIGGKVRGGSYTDEFLGDNISGASIIPLINKPRLV